MVSWESGNQSWWRKQMFSGREYDLCLFDLCLFGPHFKTPGTDTDISSLKTCFFVHVQCFITVVWSLICFWTVLQVCLWSFTGWILGLLLGWSTGGLWFGTVCGLVLELSTSLLGSVLSVVWPKSNMFYEVCIVNAWYSCCSSVCWKRGLVNNP